MITGIISPTRALETLMEMGICLFSDYLRIVKINNREFAV